MCCLKTRGIPLLSKSLFFSPLDKPERQYVCLWHGSLDTWSSSCVMPKINLRCLRLKQICLHGAAETVHSIIGWMNCGLYRMISPVQSGGNSGVEESQKGCLFHWLPHMILLNLNFCCDFFPVSIKSQYLGSTLPHKVPFVKSFICCPVDFNGFSCERGFRLQSWNGSIDILSPTLVWQSHILEAFLFVSLLHSRLSDSVSDGSDQLKDWHTGVRHVNEGTAVFVFLLFGIIFMNVWQSA